MRSCYQICSLKTLFKNFPLLLLLVSCNCDDDDLLPTIPQNAEYQISIEGEGYVGGLVSRFQIQAILVTTPTIEDGTQRNGINPIEIGIFTDPNPIVGHAGALYFGTNTSLSSLVGSRLRASAMDVAFVSIDQRANSVHVRLDGDIFGLPTARLNTFNIYNLTTGLFAQIQNVLAGEINIIFNGDDVNGDISLGGSSGFTGPSITSQYLATFAGRRIR